MSGSPSHFLCSTMELHSQSPGSEKGNTYGSLAFNLAKSSKDVEAYEANNYERKMTEARNASTAGKKSLLGILFRIRCIALAGAS